MTLASWFLVAAVVHAQVLVHDYYLYNELFYPSQQGGHPNWDGWVSGTGVDVDMSHTTDPYQGNTSLRITPQSAGWSWRVYTPQKAGIQNEDCLYFECYVRSAGEVQFRLYFEGYDKQYGDPGWGPVGSVRFIFSSSTPSDYLAGGTVSSEWQLIRIPLSDIVSLGDRNGLLSIYKFGLEEDGPYSTIYLDNVGFVRSVVQAHNIAIDDHGTPAVDETAEIETDFTDEAQGPLVVNENHSLTDDKALTFQTLLGSSFRIMLYRPAIISKIYLTQGSLNLSGYGWDLARKIRITLANGQTVLFTDTHNLGYYKERIVINPAVVSSYVDVEVLEVYDNEVSPGQDTKFGGFTEVEVFAVETYADHTPPEIHNLSISPTTCAGSFTTSEPSYFNVRYATDSLIGQETGWTTSLNSSHGFTLPSSVSGMVQVYVTDQYGNLARLDDRTFSVVKDQDVAMAMYYDGRLSDLRVDGWGVSLQMAASWIPDPFRSSQYVGVEVKLGYKGDIVSDPTRVHLYGDEGYFQRISDRIMDADLRGYDAVLVLNYSTEFNVTNLVANALNVFKLPVSERGVPFYLRREYYPQSGATYDQWLTYLYGKNQGTPEFQALSANEKSILYAQYLDRVPFSFAEWLSYHYDLTPGELTPEEEAQYHGWYNRTLSVLDMNEVERLYFYVGELARLIKGSGLSHRFYLVHDWAWNWTSDTPYPLYEWSGWGQILADLARMLKEGAEPDLGGVAWEKQDAESDNQWFSRVASELAGAPDKPEHLFTGISDVTLGLGMLDHMNQRGMIAHTVFDIAAPKFDFLYSGEGRQATWVRSRVDEVMFARRKQWMRYYNTTFFKPLAIHSSGIWDSRYVLTSNPIVDIESDCVDEQTNRVKSNCPPYEAYASQSVTLQPHGNEDLQNYDWYRLFSPGELDFLRRYGVMFVMSQSLVDDCPVTGQNDAGFLYYESGQKKLKKSFYTFRDSSDTLRLDGRLDGQENRVILPGTVRVDGTVAVASTMDDPPSFSPVSSTLHCRATISWQTALPCKGQIWYGTVLLSGPAALDLTTPEPDDRLWPVHTVRYDQQSDILDLGTAHSVTLLGLARNTTYHIRIKATDVDSNVYVSDDYSFTTPDVSIVTDPPHLDGYFIPRQSDWRFRFQRLDSIGNWTDGWYDDGEGGKEKTADAANAWFRNWTGGVAPFGVRWETEQATCIAPTGWVNKVCNWWPDVPSDDYYFRRRFYLSAAEWNELQDAEQKPILEIRYDNRFQAYINGTKVAENLDPGHVEAGYDSFDLSAYKSAFQQGRNVLAVNVKPRGTGDWRSMLFDAALRSELPTNGPPALGDVIPASGSSSPGVTVYFTTTWSDPDGWQDLKQCYFHIGDSPTLEGNVTLLYSAQTNKLWIRSDDGTQWIGGFAPQSVNFLENNQAQVDCQLTTVQGSENTLSVQWAIRFQGSFVGTKKTGLKCKDVSGARTKGQWRGTWTISP
jgi:hypothetical protein